MTTRNDYEFRLFNRMADTMQALTRVFPYLAMRMPAFARQDQLIAQHKVIHQGLEKLESYARDCLGGQKDFKMHEIKSILDSFGKTLWDHLDDEVRELGAEQTRKYWTAEEMTRMPM
ncbi:uncharacterized protein N7458_003696 [Penicillium daleae]|uniref:Hemerythrin-like domain-containing protein n=1 Tax=Penicillium daleae TaxID=63821 RepID=A0AAD6G5S5_9EURO|nr:uncharacterized protein N7458_003696 [Penicillium daleae]KAJ5456113.1 hypothetical protein N7458_003696 [Penicillium daleae]